MREKYEKIFFFLAAAGCKSKNSFSVTFENQCDADIQSAFVEYYVGDTDEIGKILVASSSAAAGTTGSSLPKGETLVFRFEKDMFSEDADLRAFSFELYLVLADGSEVRAGSLGIAVSCAAMRRKASSFSAEIAENLYRWESSVCSQKPPFCTQRVVF